MSRIKLLPWILAFGLGTSSWAGFRDVGNGGFGIIQTSDNLVYLYDFVEAGVEENPYLDPDSQPDPKVLQTLRNSLWAGAPAVGVAAKLAEVSRVSPLLGTLLLKMIEAYDWSLVNEQASATYDGDLSRISVPADKLVQAAVRNGGSIRIQAGVWKKLPPAHQIGLIIHEAIYSFIDQTYSVEGRHESNFKVDPPAPKVLSAISRDLVGLIFSARWKTAGRAILRRALLADTAPPYSSYLLTLIASEPVGVQASSDGSALTIAPRVGFWVASNAPQPALDHPLFDVFFGITDPEKTLLDRVCPSPDISTWVLAYWVSDTLLLNDVGFSFAPQQLQAIGEYSGVSRALSSIDSPEANGGRTLSCRDWAISLWKANSKRFEGFSY